MVNNKLNEAIAFASEKHINQTRKDGSPYIFHPLEILMAVKELFSMQRIYGIDVTVLLYPPSVAVSRTVS